MCTESILFIKTEMITFYQYQHEFYQKTQFDHSFITFTFYHWLLQRRVKQLILTAILAAVAATGCSNSQAPVQTQTQAEDGSYIGKSPAGLVDFK